MHKKLLNMSTEPSSLTVRNKSVTEAEIILYGTIGDGWDDTSVSAKKFSDMLKEIPSTVKNISVRINSPGGDVFQGYTISQRLKQHPAKVTTYVDGLAASIASVIALAGDKVVMGEYAQFMIHNAWSFCVGNAREMENLADRLHDIDGQLESIYMKKTGMTRGEIQDYMMKETFFNAEQCKALGFCDEVAGDEVQIAASAIKDSSWIKNAPAGIRTKHTEAQAKAVELKNKIEGFLKARPKA